MGKIKIFCSGCTEHIGIIEFLKKVNPLNEYECFGDLKNSCKKSAEEVRKYVYKDSDNKLKVKEAINEENIKCPISGKTGEALRKYASKMINVFHRRNAYLGYIFLDDLDSDPFKDSFTKEYISREYWNIIKEFDNKVEKEIRNNVSEIKLVVLLAIPEIESWFLYAWDTAVSNYYNDVELTNAIKSYLQDNEFKNYWDNFEEWCPKIIHGKHFKISEFLIDSFLKVQLLDDIEQNEETMPNLKYLGLENIIFRHKKLAIKSYVKKKDGPYILSLIEPSVLEEKSSYIQEKFEQIRKIE